MTTVRHQSSLESIIDFCFQQPPFANADERAQSVARFYRIDQHFEAAETNRPPGRITALRLSA